MRAALSLSLSLSIYYLAPTAKEGTITPLPFSSSLLLFRYSLERHLHSLSQSPLSGYGGHLPSHHQGLPNVVGNIPRKEEALLSLDPLSFPIVFSL